MRCNYKVIPLIMCLLLPMLLLAGCYDKKELDYMAYPLVMGLDRSASGGLLMSLHIPTPITIAGGEGGSGGKESSSIMSVDCTSITKEINISHVETLVISRELAEEGIFQYVNSLVRIRRFRPDVFVIISEDKAYKYLENIIPRLENNTAKYFELLMDNSYTSIFPKTTLDVITDCLYCEGKQPVVALSDIGKYETAEELDDSAATEAFTLNSEFNSDARDLAVAAQKNNIVMGLAVFRNGKMVGTCNGAETICYQMLTGGFRQTTWAIPDYKQDGGIIVLLVTESRKPLIRITKNESNAAINIGLELECDLLSVQGNQYIEYSPEIIQETFKEVIKNNIEKFLKRTRDDFDSDICGFGRYLKSKFLTWDEWKSYNWYDKYKNTTFTVDVGVKLRRTGLIVNEEADGLTDQERR
jgi:spore germination protein KC